MDDANSGVFTWSDAALRPFVVFFLVDAAPDPAALAAPK
jgi:hypothetical protein